MKRLISLALIVVVSIAVWIACSGDQPVGPANDPQSSGSNVQLSSLRIAPIPGLTTTWHYAPTHFALPREVGAIELLCLAPTNAVVTWRGATEVSRSEEGSVAVCLVSDVGTHHKIEVTIDAAPVRDGNKKDDIRPYGTSSKVSCSFDVVETSISDIRVEGVSVSAPPLAVGESTGNEERLRLLFGASISSVQQEGPDHFAAAANTLVRFSSRVSPPALAPLMEWRVDGRPVLLGQTGDHLLLPITGTRLVSVGPLDAGGTIRIETYSVSIELEDDDGSGLKTGEPQTFVATTDPPGFEDRVTWLSATLYGSATPTVGRGERFTATFNDTRRPDGTLCMGVRADNTSFVLDNLICSAWETAVNSSIDRWNAVYGTNVQALGWTELYVINSETVRQQVAGLMTDPDETWMPSGDADAPAAMTALRVSDDPAIPIGKLAQWVATVYQLVEIGHRVVSISWDGPEPFTTYCVVDCNGIIYDSMISNTAGGGVEVVANGPIVAAIRCLHLKMWWAWQGNNWNNWTRGFIIADNNPTCSNGFVVACDKNCVPSMTLGSAEINCRTTQVTSQCCQLEYSWAWACGFKSIEVEADGFSLKVEGIIGSSGKGNGSCTDCCTN